MNYDDRLRMPHTVYRCYDEADVLLYVGVTYNPKQRLRQHRRAAWFARVKKTTTTTYPNAARAFEAERAAHLTEDPAHSANGSNPLRHALRALDDQAAA